MDNTAIDQQEKIQAHIAEEKAAVSNVDFRMVTFTLAGRDYAIDIMKVKEISKDKKFTYVPNAAPFVMGVYNLRGDIISVIDLRVFFNQMSGKTNNDTFDKLENMIILRLEDHTIAVIVDTIDKVVGIPSDTIQPPHPLFGDINVKYISGIVESGEKLYVILDVDKIFNSDESENIEQVVSNVDIKVDQVIDPTPNASDDELNIKFITESLGTFKKMFVSSINVNWMRKRYEGWSEVRRSEGKNIQFEEEGDALKYLNGFYSPYTGDFWDTDYINALEKIIVPSGGNNFYVLNIGCGHGHESYSLASIIKKNLPDSQLKILAYDNDLMGISSAPSLSVDKSQVPNYYWDKLIEGVSGSWQFDASIRDSIIFEYHDIEHSTNLPALDLVVVRDLLSLLKPELQLHVLALIMDNLKPGGILMVGINEEIDTNMGFDKHVVDGITFYLKK